MKTRHDRWLAFLTAALAVCFCVSMTAGKYPVYVTTLGEKAHTAGETILAELL